MLDDDERLRDLITSLPTRKRMIEALGVALAKKNYVRLEGRAAELGLDLPPKWGVGRAS